MLAGHQIDEMCRLYRAGMRQRDIAEQFRVSQGYVSLRVKHLVGGRRPTFGMSVEDAFRYYVPEIPATDDCIEWPGNRNDKNYGHFKSGGVTRFAHRESYRMHVGAVADDQVVRHTCDHPACVNPRHLLLGTKRDNRLDMVERGRARESWPGESNPYAKLTNAAVHDIRTRARQGAPHHVLAANYAVSVSCVNKVVQRQTWKHLP